MRSHSIIVMRRARIDPKSFDLSTECPECYYKVQPHEFRWVDGERMRCPNCKRDVVMAATPSKSIGDCAKELLPRSLPHVSQRFLASRARLDDERD